MNPTIEVDVRQDIPFEHTGASQVPGQRLKTALGIHRTQNLSTRHAMSICLTAFTETPMVGKTVSIKIVARALTSYEHAPFTLFSIA